MRHSAIARYVRGVTSEEVVLSLLRSELADRWENTKGIASQHDDVAWLAVNRARDLRVRDELDGVGAARVLGDRRIIEVREARLGIVHDVLQDRAEADRAENLGLLLRRKVDALGVASTLDVEDTGIRPNVLVVANEQTVGIRRESGLAGTRETEEESNIAFLHSDVCRRVEGKLSELDWLQVVLRKEAN